MRIVPISALCHGLFPRSRSLHQTLSALALVCLLALPSVAAGDEPTAGSEGLGDSYFPALGNGGYDVLHYDISMDVDMQAQSFQAVAKLSIQATQALSAFNVELWKLKVSQVAVNGAAASFTRVGREMQITPQKPLASGAEFELVVHYGGSPEPAEDASRPGRLGPGWHFMPSGVFTMSECVGAANWFPCNDHPRDRASFTFRITVAKPYVVAANGLLLSETDHGATRTYLWECEDEMATYLATVNIAEFEMEYQEGPRGLPIWNFFPKDYPAASKRAFARQGEIIEFFESIFGPYPFHSAGAIVSNEPLPGALETTTRPVYGRGMPELVVAHEIAHQWFGDSVAVDDWSDLWLNEGFASYAEVLWSENFEGFDRADAKLSQLHRLVYERSVKSPVAPGVQSLFGLEVYQRGSWTLHCLRSELGDEDFFEILYQWTQKQKGKSVRTADFIAHCEAISGRELDEFFETYLFSARTPQESGL